MLHPLADKTQARAVVVVIAEHEVHGAIGSLGNLLDEASNGEALPDITREQHDIRLLGLHRVVERAQHVRPQEVQVNVGAPGRSHNNRSVLLFSRRWWSPTALAAARPSSPCFCK